MAKTKQKTSSTDSTYFLKLVMYLVIGSQWAFLIDKDLTRQIPLPWGLLIGLLFASHDHFRLDRRVEYAVLLVAALIGFWSNVGVYIIAL